MRALVIALGLLLAAVVGGPAVAASSVAAAEPTTTSASAPVTEVAPVGGASDEPGIGGLEAGSNTPSPRGEPAPPRTQRIADTAIFVGLLVVFVAGVAVAVWSARRSRSTS